MEKAKKYLEEIEKYIGPEAKDWGMTIDEYLAQIDETVISLMYLMEKTGLRIDEILVI